VGVNDIIQPSNGLLTNAENVEVSIRNFGTATQTSIPLELRVDGNLIASETYTGSLSPNTTDTYTFSATVDLSTSGQTYNIEVTSLLAADEFNPNDSFSKDVTHLLGNDVGALEITAPETGVGLGVQTVSITVKNFGANPQSNFDVEYSIDGATPVVETFSGTINSEEELSFDFATQGDFTALGTYNISAKTSLAGDQETANDETTSVVENLFCQPSMDCSFGDGLQLFSVAEINNPSGCEGYGDFRSQVANLEPDTTYSLTVTTGYGDQHLNVWIDFNDDFTFTPNELVVNDYVIAPGQAGGSYTETLDLVVPAGAATGQHLMRAKTNWQAPVPADACAVTNFGETEDYTANIGTLSTGDVAIRDAELIVTTLENNHFEVSLITEFDGAIYAAIYNTLGQQLGFKNLNRSGNSYNLNLDMSAAASGVYLIKVGGQYNSTFKTARIIVK
jgi:hypothetical protein